MTYSNELDERGVLLSTLAGMSPTQRLRAGISIRVSKVAGRKDLASPEIQETAGRERAAELGWDVVDVYTDIDVSAYGGDSLKKRDDFKRLMADAKSERINAVIIYESARLGRNEAETFGILDTLTASGVKSLKGVIDDWSWVEGEDNYAAALDVLGDARFSRKMSKRWKDAQKRRLAAGKPHSGGERFGYIYDRETKSYSPDPVTGPVLAEAYTRYISGQGSTFICRWLNAEGYRTTRGSEYAANSLMRTLDSGFGAGLIRLGSRQDSEYIPGEHEAVISQDTWTLYRAQRRVKSSPAFSRSKNDWELSGLLKCGLCGSAMTRIKYRSGTQGSRCSSWAQGKGCTGVWWPLQHVNVAVMLYVSRDALATFDDALNPVDVDTLTSRLAAAEARLEEAQSALTQAAVSFVGLDAVTVQQALSALTEKRDEAAQGVEAARLELASIRSTDDFSEVFDRWYEATPAEKGAALRSIIDGITLFTRDGVIDGFAGPMSFDKEGNMSTIQA